MQRAYHALFVAHGSSSAPRFGGMVLAGLDMALWDVVGKATGRAVHELLGGSVRDHIQYFGFPQGETAEALAGDAQHWAESGCDVIYVKIGRGEALDLSIAAQVRAVIGNRRLRLDANEAWDTLTAQRMIRALAAFDVEFIEQPTNSNSLAALAQVKSTSSIAIAADQLVFTPEDVYAVCRQQAADLIVLGLHETGGIGRFRKSAAIAEAAGLNVCLHGLYETGITTCASNQVGATLNNLDDGNQYMNHFLAEDIIERPDLRLIKGRLPVLPGPGLGFEVNWDAVGRAEEAYRASYGRLSAIS
jgi:L-alanine-DL-glutamate epimerase-like enolase superfamily enzyme